MKAFLSYHPGKRTTFQPAPFEFADCDALKLKFFRVDHSIPGCGAFALDTPIGWVVYTGDLRRHGHSHWRTEQFAQQAAAVRPRLLIGARRLLTGPLEWAT